MLYCAQGGRGHGLTRPQEKLLGYLNGLNKHEWVAEWCIATGKRPPYPTYYSVDLYCPELKVCIEVDGPSHRHPQVKKADSRKTRFLRRNGYMVLRVSNSDAMIPTSAYCAYLRKYINRRALTWEKDE